ncbi:hypothetical protein [Streptosporangium sp. NPDC023615]|uniref:hypothetical protein n=1 Tax=Streptosporangium sp. NPDC023615 TaxID=3154794 RepID=UPI0034461269
MADETTGAMNEQDNTVEREAMREALAEARRRDLGADARPADLADVDATDVISGVTVTTDDPDNLDDDSDDEQAPPSEEQARQIWDEALEGWRREGRDRVHTADLAELLAGVQRGRRFLYAQVARWQQEGHLVARPEADGWNLIPSPAPDAPHSP